jgi:hypothetical protein
MINTITSRGSFLKAQGQRFLLSPCGQTGKWVSPLELASRPGWIDCTDMDDEQFQKVIAERLANRPYIVGMTV